MGAGSVSVYLHGAAAAAGWLAQRGARALAADSRRVRAGDAFVAWPGLAHDGRAYVDAALAAGASACLIEAHGAPAFGFADGERVAAVVGLKAQAGEIASAFLGEPSAALDVLAVTGTNGKTSTTWWTAQLLSRLGRRCGVVGTLGVGEPGAEIVATGLTTPDPVTLQNAFRAFADQGFAACAVEASSIGLNEERLSGTRIAVALYTNFTQDHLDYHRSMDAYWAAKARLFAWPGLRAAVVNIDDAQGAALAAGLSAPLAVWTYSTRGAATLRADAIAYRGGLCFDVCEGDVRAKVQTALIGEYNVSNLLAVIGGLRALGHGLEDIAAACGALTPVPGRMQRVPAPHLSPSPSGRGRGEGVRGEATAARSPSPQPSPQRGEGVSGPEVVVDYAHTPDALEKALLALQPFARERGGRLVCVFGCGGNRDTRKRPLMGALAQRLADRVVATSDNPRDEAPGAILADIVAGMTLGDRVAVIEDRRAAIAHAVSQAEARDVVLIAGKGHEDYQEIAGVKLPFSDVDEAAAALAARKVSP